MKVAILGGGFTGAVVAIHLLDRLRKGGEIVVYDPADRLGRGIAYAESPAHYLLNVPAHVLSFSSRDTGRFLQWALANRPDAARFRESDGSYFFPRAWFGRYVEETLAARVAARAGSIRFEHSRAVARKVSWQPAGMEVEAGDGAAVFDHAVIAIGNAPPRPIPVDESAVGLPQVVQSAWALFEAPVDPDADVVVVGSGLTMADVVAELEHRGHRGRVVCVSRNGRRPHRASGAVEEFVPPFPLSGRTARQLLAQVRRWIRHSIRTSGDWRPVVDHLRRHCAQTWRLLDWPERERLQRHVRSIWEVHRFQMPPPAHRRIESMVEAERLVHIKASAIRVERGGLRVDTAEGEQVVPADLIVNATGFDRSYATSSVPLENLLRHPAIDLREVRRRGLDVDDSGAPVALRGDVRLLAIGHLARADHGEMNTVNAIGAIAEALAERLAERPTG